MFKQRFQSQTLLACLFNYISGRLQLSNKSGLCFHRLLEFSACFDPAASIQFNNSIQNKPSQPCWGQCQLCSSIHQGQSGSTRFFLFICTFWALCHCSQQFWHSRPDVWKVPLITHSAVWSKNILCAFPCSHGKDPHQHLSSALACNNSEGWSAEIAKSNLGGKRLKSAIF